jgi:hypothetical protein
VKFGTNWSFQSFQSFPHASSCGFSSTIHRTMTQNPQNSMIFSYLPRKFDIYSDTLCNSHLKFFANLFHRKASFVQSFNEEEIRSANIRYFFPEGCQSPKIEVDATVQLAPTQRKSSEVPVQVQTSTGGNSRGKSPKAIDFGNGENIQQNVQPLDKTSESSTGGRSNVPISVQPLTNPALEATSRYQTTTSRYEASEQSTAARSGPSTLRSGPVTTLSEALDVDSKPSEPSTDRSESSNLYSKPSNSPFPSSTSPSSPSTSPSPPLTFAPRITTPRIETTVPALSSPRGIFLSTPGTPGLYITPNTSKFKSIPLPQNDQKCSDTCCDDNRPQILMSRASPDSCCKGVAKIVVPIPMDLLARISTDEIIQVTSEANNVEMLKKLLTLAEKYNF